MSRALTIAFAPEPDLVRPGRDVAVVFAAWTPPKHLWLAGKAPLTGSAAALTLERPPERGLTRLPEELGGPFTFAVGYLAVVEAGFPGGRPILVDAAHRVLYLEAPFPAAAFRAAIAAKGQPVGPEAEALIDRLAAFPAGLSLARVTRRTTSLLGFEPARGCPVPLRTDAALEWPPERF